MRWKKSWATTPTPPVFSSNTRSVRHLSAKLQRAQPTVPPIGTRRSQGGNQSVHTGAANKPVGQQRQSSLHPQLSQDLMVTGMSLCLLPHRWGDAGSCACTTVRACCRRRPADVCTVGNGSKSCRSAWKQPWMESDGLLLGEEEDEIIKRMKCQLCVQGQVVNLFNV